LRADRLSQEVLAQTHQVFGIIRLCATQAGGKEPCEIDGVALRGKVLTLFERRHRTPGNRFGIHASFLRFRLLK
jgi:hypothetical protein